MKTFRDTADREWTVEINVTTLKRVKDLAGVDLTALIRPSDPTFQNLSSDMFKLFDVLVALVKPQLEQRQITADVFGQSLDENSVEAAVTALLEGVIDFFQADKRAILRRALLKVTTAADKVRRQSLDAATKQVESAEFDQIIESAMSGSSSTGSPESSASTPAR